MNPGDTHIKNSRCLVAGGNGFIGSRVVDSLLLLGAQEVVIVGQGVSRTKDTHVRYVVCDLCRDESVEIVAKMGTFDYIFNVVGVTDQRMPHPNPVELFDANVRTLIHLTQGIVWESVRGAVHVGSNIEYGLQPIPHHEDLKLLPTNIYGWSKASASLYAQTMAKSGFAKWCVARPFFAYGPGKQTGLIPQLIKTLSEGKPCTVFNHTRDPVYVDDVAEGLIRLAVCPNAQGEIVNICTGKEIPIRKIAELIQRKIGKGSIVFESENRPGDLLQSCGSITKLKILTAWSPATNLSQGLEKIIKTI